MTVTATALATPRRLGPGDDLVGALLEAVAAAGERLQDGDVLTVASKAVAKVEGQQRSIAGPDVRQAKRDLARAQAKRIVADDPAVLIVETAHGYVCANAGIDASNAQGLALLLPDDPDASAARIRAGLRDRTGADVGVIVTDTFGRPWRIGQTDVALGVAGILAVRDERGQHDLDGSELDVTVAAVADEIAGLADLVRSKASGAPFVLVRGFDLRGAGSGRDLVRDATEDLFRHGGATAVEAAVTARRTVRAFTDDAVPTEVIEAAVAAAATAPAPHHTRPWRFIDLAPETRAVLLDAMADAWRADLAGDGLPDDRIARRIARSDDILRAAPRVLAAFVDVGDAHTYPDPRRRQAERDLFVLSAGAALQSLQIVLAGHGFGAAWISSTSFCSDVAVRVLSLPHAWQAVGMVAVGRAVTPPPPRGGPTAEGVLLRR